MSKKPPLGAAYFRWYAEQFVQQGLAPQTLEYTFPESERLKRDGATEKVPYMLKGRSAELFLDHWIETWDRAYPGVRRPPSPLVEHYLDPVAGKVAMLRQTLEEMRDDKSPRAYLARQHVLAQLDVLREEGTPLEEKIRQPRDQRKPARDPWDIREEIHREIMENGQEQQQQQELIEFELWKQEQFDRLLGKPDYVERQEQRKAEQRKSEQQGGEQSKPDDWRHADHGRSRKGRKRR